MDKLIAALVVIVFFLFLAVLFALLVAFPVMLIWNKIMPQLFELTKITFWQAFGLALLARLLLGTGSTGTKEGK
ncbi:MAG: hypothetical protein IPK44_01275 [Candidatus Accumulibacter sp.]|uniref:hypothetical protein n=1 Tax=Accumulibacter sp. TaxID=2053492 RepID=UPI0025871C3B|nr:hypothetical protein [Accumulibacter sp.]MBK8113230.1 hypothetical protein [Accumulibacter sp.]